MNILIVYASRHGTTRELVDHIAAGLSGSVDIIDLRTQTMPTLDRYQKVIVGGPIYGGSFPAPIRRFCEKHKTQLLSRKVGLFLSCISGFPRADRYLKTVFPRWLLDHAYAKEQLGGRIVRKTIRPSQRLLLALLVGIREDRDTLNPDALGRLVNATNKI